MNEDIFLKEVALKQAVISGAGTARHIVRAAKEFYRFLKDEHAGLDNISEDPDSHPDIIPEEPTSLKALPPVKGLDV